MASCKIVTTYPEPETQPKPDPITEVVLRMTVEEAGTLKQVINKIGGDPEGPRGVLEEIIISLSRAGVESTTHETEIYFSVLDGVPYLRIEKGDG